MKKVQPKISEDEMLKWHLPGLGLIRDPPHMHPSRGARPGAWGGGGLPFCAARH